MFILNNSRAKKKEKKCLLKCIDNIFNIKYQEWVSMISNS